MTAVLCVLQVEAKKSEVKDHTRDEDDDDDDDDEDMMVRNEQLQNCSNNK